MFFLFCFLNFTCNSSACITMYMAKAMLRSPLSLASPLHLLPLVHLEKWFNSIICFVRRWACGSECTSCVLSVGFSEELEVQEAPPAYRAEGLVPLSTLRYDFVHVFVVWSYRYKIVTGTARFFAPKWSMVFFKLCRIIWKDPWNLGSMKIGKHSWNLGLENGTFDFESKWDPSLCGF